ncbi:E3 ubiquitin-protein ligase TRIM7 [Amia ocellicauda]|uniref:E3 ubiquitin-protein ligase TRIM7 n=1 Tax=Amia ocellicauda TaxID=2972642 RepID=UPI00346426C2|nr:BT1A1 protein [Amia calva]
MAQVQQDQMKKPQLKTANPTGETNIVTRLHFHAEGSIRECLSFGSFGSHSEEVTKVKESQSYGYGRPNLSLAQAATTKLKDVMKTSREALKKLLKGSSKNSRSKQAQNLDECKTIIAGAQSQEECKAIIRNLASELNRVSKHCAVLSRACESEDTISLEECREFILEWAEGLRNMAQVSAGKNPSNKSAEPKSAEQQEQAAASPSTPTQEPTLKDSQHILSEWAKSLGSRPKGSVCPGRDVAQVLQELGGQWKTGQLPNILPVLEFIMWSVIKESPQEGTVPQLWLSSKQRFRSQAAVKHIPDSVWKWIKQSSVDIKLDPKTANPDLKVSTDGKRVRMEEIVESKSNPRKEFRAPHKYDGWWCALGTEGFTSGRYYWEVNVRSKKDWRIGVVSESAPRNGFTDMNTRTGYWTLRLQHKEFRALSVPATHLPDSLAPSVVGVYLDLEEGQLSFYNVESSCHIYTFNEQIIGKVYPVFGTTETGMDLVISTPAPIEI